MKQSPAGALVVGSRVGSLAIGMAWALALGVVVGGARGSAAAEEEAPAEERAPAKVAAGAAAPAERTNVAVVDVERAIALCKPGEAIQKQLDDLAATKQKPLLAKQEELRKATAALEAEKEKLSEEDAENRVLALDRLEEDIEQGLEEAREEIGLAEERKLDPLLEKAQGFIKELAEKQGFTIVLEKTNPELLYASDTVDLTDALIERLNQGK